jgi:2-dehydro-3-deoxyphosphogluconate aldolase/(4S)-4-hydroxy-2-oxoglutarate aldolase
MAAGGMPALKALSAVFGGVRFCPTGGITQESAADWLGLPSVACIGGSWLAPAGESVDAGAIEARARAASALTRA